MTSERDGSALAGGESTWPYAGDAGETSIPSTLGRFAIARVLGRGGMGIVLEASDPALDRRVAIKLLPELWGQADADARARLVHEARAMARLNHPNVVMIYEVGELDGKPFLAMELVDGVTLRTWQGREPRPWRDVVATYVAAGRGLAAAHGAGLVHRDFKPENVLIAADGRPRVTDFGLVSAGGQPVADSDARAAPGAGTGITVRGSVLGTPAYMAPEQWRGATVDERTDQFAFCVALWEAIYGERPFAGDTAAELRAAILGDRRRAPPRGLRAPARLAEILERGVDPAPERRWPSMLALVDELDRLTVRRRAVRVALGSAAVAVVALGVASAAVRSNDDCPAPEARAAATWGPIAQLAIRAHVLAVDPSGGAHRFETVASAAGPYLEDWKRGMVGACRAARGETARDPLALQRTGCLADRLAQLDGVLRIVAEARDAAALDGALPVLAALPGVAGCSDAAVLASFAVPPEPSARAEADAIVADARALDLARLAGRHHDVADRGPALLARARKLGHPPTLSKVILAVALLTYELTDAKRATELLTELTEVAARGHDDHVAAQAWTHLLKFTAHDLARPSDARALIPAARAAVVRAGDGLDLRTRLLVAEADVLTLAQELAEATRKADQATQLLVDAGAERAGSPLRARLAEVLAAAAATQHLANQFGAAIATLRRAIAIWDAVYGPDHPATATAYLNIGNAYDKDGKLGDALVADAEAVRIRRARLGDSPALAWALSLHANVLRRLRRMDEALVESEAAYRMASAMMDDADPNRISVILAAAAVYEDLERYEGARAMYDDVIAIAERTKAQTVNLPITYYNRAEVARKTGHCDDAIADYERSVDLFTQIRGAANYYNEYPLSGLGQCRILQHRPTEAIAPLERAISLDAPGSSKEPRIASRFLLGHALVGAGRDVARGRTLITTARRDAAATSPATLAELDGLLVPVAPRASR